MENAWKVQWQEDHKLLFRKFEGDRPTEAVAFGKKLKSRGITVVDIISARRAYPPVKQLTAPQPGLLWCPYCMKWREFQEASVIRAGWESPELLRCPTCTISVRDAYVRMYNPELVIQYEMRLEMRARMREQARESKKSQNVRRPRGGIRMRR